MYEVHAFIMATDTQSVVTVEAKPVSQFERVMEEAQFEEQQKNVRVYLNWSNCTSQISLFKEVSMARVLAMECHTLVWS